MMDERCQEGRRLGFMETQKMPEALTQKTHTPHTEATNADLGHLAPMLL